MKILHTLAQLPAKTGSGIYFSNMIEGFKKYDYEQKAIFTVQDEFKWDTLENDDQYPVNFKSNELTFPIVGMSDVMAYESTKYSSMTDEMINTWLEVFRRKLLAIKEEFTPDIIFAHHLWILTSITREVFPQAKIIGICHNTDLRQSIMNPKLKDKYVKNIGRLDYIFSISDNQHDEIVKIYGVDREKIITVGGAYNQDNFYPVKEKIYSDKVRLVFCAKIDPSKGLYELIEVYKSLALDDVELEIIGDPDPYNKKKLEIYIQEDKSIKLSRAVRQDELGNILRNKDIFVMPSFYEGVALMAIETLACGLHVVTTEIQALMSLLGKDIEDSGIIKYVPLPRIYDTDKPLEEDLPVFKEDLRQAILLQIEKIRDKKEVDENIKEKIKSFSWDKLVEKMNDIIKALI